MLSGSLWSFQKDFITLSSTAKSDRDSRVKNEQKTLNEKLRTFPLLHTWTMAV